MQTADWQQAVRNSTDPLTSMSVSFPEIRRASHPQHCALAGSIAERSPEPRKRSATSRIRRAGVSFTFWATAIAD